MWLLWFRKQTNQVLCWCAYLVTGIRVEDSVVGGRFCWFPCWSGRVWAVSFPGKRLKKRILQAEDSGFWRTIEKMEHLVYFIEYIWLNKIIKHYLNIIQYRGKVLVLLALILVLSPTPHIVLWTLPGVMPEHSTRIRPSFIIIKITCVSTINHLETPNIQKQGSFCSLVANRKLRRIFVSLMW